MQEEMCALNSRRPILQTGWMVVQDDYDGLNLKTDFSKGLVLQEREGRWGKKVYKFVDGWH